MASHLIVVDERQAASLLGISTATLRRLRAADSYFPRVKALDALTKYLHSELLAYAAPLPKLSPGERGLRGERKRKAEPEAAEATARTAQVLTPDRVK